MRIRWLKKGISAALAGGLFLGLAASARAYVCPDNAVLSGTYTDILVPTGAFCTLEGVTVTGNVVVQSGAALDFSSSPSSVSGNVTAVDAECVALWPGAIGAIGGNVIAIGVTNSGRCGSSFGLVGNPVCPTKVGGNLAILDSANGSLPWDFCANTTPGSTVGGNLVFANNPSTVSGFIEKDTIRGNLLFDKNSGGGTISHNMVDGNLECSNNTPLPTGSKNKVGGSFNCPNVMP